MSLKWWEKTVEYQFVLIVASKNRLFLAPLDGGEERAGDAVFSSDHRWVLIEFKKDQNSIYTEKRKFNDYAAACATLSSRDTHHHIIYGQESKEPDPRLVLRSQTYFSERSYDLEYILSNGEKFNTFKTYIEEYTEFKKGPGGGGNGGGVTMDELALVAGVNTDNNIVECMSLAEFQRQHGLEYKLELGRGGPSF